METIYGQVPSKSNSYTPIPKGARFVKSKKVTDYENSFILQLSRSLKGKNIQTNFEIHIDVFFKTKASDLDGCFKIVLDCLQKARTIKNDNKCIRIVAEKHIDREQPRVEFEIIEHI